jgi:hypothetical protein
VEKDMSENEWVLDELPSMGGLLWKAASKRGRKLAVGEGLPALSVRCNQLSFPPEELSKYAAVVGAKSTEVMPLVAPHILAAPLHLFLLVQKVSPLRAMGLIHVRNTVKVHRLIPSDALLDVHVELVESSWVHKGIEAEVRTHVRVDGELVWEESSVVFSRQPGAGDIPRVERAPLPATLENGGEAWGLPRSAGRRYAGVSGDWNPIHLYGWTAKLFGFSAPIVHGMWSFARCMSEFPMAPCVLDVAFLRPVTLPSTPSFRVHAEDHGDAVFALLRNKDNKAYLTGTYTKITSQSTTTEESR